MRFHGHLYMLWAIVIMSYAIAAVCYLAEAQSTATPGVSKPAPVRHVHDPCIIREGDYYYIFSTGPGIPMRRSKDLIRWDNVGRVFQEDVPAWAKKEIPDSKSLWAPDIAFFNRRFYVYYSMSGFGKNRSVIGVASNKTLDAASKNYKWVDEGKVIESFPHNNYNAIDANIVFPTPHTAALSFGSFWSGIKLIALDKATGKLAPYAQIISIARRPPPGAVEAPFIIRRGAYFYLFVSFDACCRGVNSTYNTRVGRATQVTGPYIDRDGKSLLDGGGTLVLGTQGTVIGPGHCAVLQDTKSDYIVHHFYDGNDNGIPTLQVRPLTWTGDGWPVAGEPLLK